LPILCLKVENLPRPNYEVTGQGHAMSKEFYRGWSGGYIGLTAPILGAELTSHDAANDVCVQELGEGYRIASHHDGKYVPGMDLDQFYDETWPAQEDLYTGGWHWYAHGNISGESRFWVEIADQPGNCWNSAASHQPLAIPTGTPVPTNAPTTDFPDERMALVMLYTKLNGQNWQNWRYKKGWSQVEYYCFWEGVDCTDGHVTRLSLSWKGLTGDMPPEIGDLTHLTKLYLGENNLNSLPSEIGSLTHLTELSLGENNLNSLPPEVWNLTNLTYLDVSGISLNSLPPEIGDLTNLTHLDVSGTSLNSLPPEIWNLTGLTHLDVSENHLNNLSLEIGDLTSLNYLDLAGNNLSSLPPEIGSLTNLTYLDLSDNNLSSLPPEIVSLINIVELYVGYNSLSSLPLEIGDLTSLNYLGLAGNNLSSLPLEIGHLTNLTYLDLSDNSLSNLPPEISNLRKLAYLWLFDNNLSSLLPEMCTSFSDDLNLTPASLCSP